MMNHKDKRAPHSATGPHESLDLFVPAAVETPMAPMQADCLYRLAAMTTVIFLLATLL
jgi:hypothetical protein